MREVVAGDASQDLTKVQCDATADMQPSRSLGHLQSPSSSEPSGSVAPSSAPAAPKLQDLIAAAQPGDTVRVVGCHAGPFRIEKPGITLLADAPGATLLGPIALIAGTLEGLTLKAAPARPQTAHGGARFLARLPPREPPFA